MYRKEVYKMPLYLMLFLKNVTLEVAFEPNFPKNVKLMSPNVKLHCSFVCP